MNTDYKMDTVLTRFIFLETEIWDGRCQLKYLAVQDAGKS